jgi:hypothetical protein
MGHGYTQIHTDKKENKKHILALSVKIRAIRVFRVLRFSGLLALSVKIRAIRVIRVLCFLPLSVQSVFCFLCILERKLYDY